MLLNAIRAGVVKSALSVVTVSLVVDAAAAMGEKPAAAPSRPTGSLRNTIALQLALERVGISPGLIDGILGAKTTNALREFQRVRGLPQSGVPDPATRAALDVDEEDAIIRYTITAADRAAVGPLPKGWIERSQMDRMPYPCLAEAVAERFHCSTGLLARLNPEVSLGSLAVGNVLLVPHAAEEPPPARATRIEVDVSNKIIRVFGAKGELLARFYCSVAAKKEKLPRGSGEVVVVAENPTYTFDPEMWPEVKGIDRKLTIPPGPRNPVGLRWIGLNLPGVGMHGTPTPEMIGKTGSHGCIRLTNWDAIRLAKMVSVGTPVRFINTPGSLADAAGH